MTPSEEQVLVIPTRVLRDAGLFQGLCRDIDRYLPIVLDVRQFTFLPRSHAEDDPNFKQLIPYVVLKYRDQVFHYRRGQGAGEKRLRALRSIGIGGHINPSDQLPSPSLAGRASDGSGNPPLARPANGRGAGGEGVHPYRQGLLRELAEEVILDSTYREKTLGFINDDATPVGQVHLGIVHIYELDAPNVTRREADLIESGFAPIAQLREEKDEFETWSQFVLDELGVQKTTPRP